MDTRFLWPALRNNDRWTYSGELQLNSQCLLTIRNLQGVCPAQLFESIIANKWASTGFPPHFNGRSSMMADYKTSWQMIKYTGLRLFDCVSFMVETGRNMPQQNILVNNCSCLWRARQYTADQSATRLPHKFKQCHAKNDSSNTEIEKTRINRSTLKKWKPLNLTQDPCFFEGKCLKVDP